MSPASAGRLFSTEPPWKPLASVLKLAVRNHHFFSHVVLALDMRLSKITTIAFFVFWGERVAMRQGVWDFRSLTRD